MGVWSRIVPDHEKKLLPLHRSKWNCCQKSKSAGKHRMHCHGTHIKHLGICKTCRDCVGVIHRKIATKRTVRLFYKRRLLLLHQMKSKYRKSRNSKKKHRSTSALTHINFGNTDMTDSCSVIDATLVLPIIKLQFDLNMMVKGFLNALDFILYCIQLAYILFVVVITETCVWSAQKMSNFSFEDETKQGLTKIISYFTFDKQKWIKSFLHDMCSDFSQGINHNVMIYPAWKSHESKNLQLTEPEVHTSAMQNEMMRLSTFHCFPPESGMSSIRAASAGFIYEGNSDEITCFSCGLRLRNLNFSSNIIQEHMERAARCSFINTLDVAGTGNYHGVQNNVALCTDVVVDEPHSPVHPSSAASYNVDSYLSATGESLNINLSVYGRDVLQEKADIFVDSSVTTNLKLTTDFNSNPDEKALLDRLSQIIYPEYKLVKIRRITYSNWRISFLHPYDLSECGFFHTNFEDCVRCFCCGIGLRNWEMDDNPWVEHARWSPKCEYLILKKSRRFIENVLHLLGMEKDCPEENAAIAMTENDRASMLSYSGLNNIFQHESANYIITEKIFNVDQVKTAMTTLANKMDLQKISKQMLINTIIEQQHIADSSLTDSKLCLITSRSSSDEQKTSENNVIEKDDKNKENKDAEKMKKETDELHELYTCKICLDEKVSITFIPCGHLVSCRNCSPKLRKCPLCRTFIKSTIKTKI